MSSTSVPAKAIIEESTVARGLSAMHSSGARTFRVRPWFVNEGTLTVALSFASGKFKLT